MPVTTEQTAKLRRYWDKHALRYDRQMQFWDRRLFGDTRAWICQQATGPGLGGRDRHRPEPRSLSGGGPADGVDFSPAMLAQARDRARQLGRTVELVEGDAQALGFSDHSFDTVVCTFSLCALPDDHRAIAEMRRVLRPGGRLLLADYVASSAWWARAVQRLMELVTVPLGGEHVLRRPAEHVRAQGFRVERQERFKLGIVERLAARKPATSPAG